MGSRLQTVIVILAAISLAWVLVSPAPDELPGTNTKQAPLFAALQPLLGAAAVEMTRALFVSLEIDTPGPLDVLAAGCVRLC